MALATALDNDYELIYDTDEHKDRMHGKKDILIKKGDLDVAANIVYRRQGPSRMQLRIFRQFLPNMYIDPVLVKNLNTTHEAFQEIMKYIDDHNNMEAENNLQNSNDLSANLGVNNSH